MDRLGSFAVRLCFLSCQSVEPTPAGSGATTRPKSARNPYWLVLAFDFHDAPIRYADVNSGQQWTK
jgi:hypothetical protein